MITPLVLKLGGELIETALQRSRIAALAKPLSSHRPLVIVHGGGRSIDAELARRNVAPKKVDGLRITDAPTLEAVIAVLAGSANTDLVAALVGEGVGAVGLTGVDAGMGRAARLSAHRAADGTTVDLGFVGDPVAADAGLLHLLLGAGYVPVVASLGVDAELRGGIPNVNADVMAARIAEAVGAHELIIAGATPGVLDRNGDLIASLDLDSLDAVIADGTATAGMIAKLSACRTALLGGVARLRIVDGRALDGTSALDDVPGTEIAQSAGLRS